MIMSRRIHVHGYGTMTREILRRQIQQRLNEAAFLANNSDFKRAAWAVEGSGVLIEMLKTEKRLLDLEEEEREIQKEKEEQETLY